MGYSMQADGYCYTEWVRHADIELVVRERYEHDLDAGKTRDGEHGATPPVGHWGIVFQAV